MAPTTVQEGQASSSQKPPSSESLRKRRDSTSTSSSVAVVDEESTSSNSTPPIPVNQPPPPAEYSRGKNKRRASSNDKPPPLWKSVFARFGSLELENKGSVARDHLALERTFLAYLRTSLAFASIGVAVTQLFRLNAAIAPTDPPSGHTTLRHMGKPLGATFIALGLVVLVVGWQRYYESQGWLVKGKFPASRGGVFALSFMAAAITVVSLVVILVVEPANDST